MIRKVAIMGKGALGMLYGEQLLESGCAEVMFIMDEARLAKHRAEVYKVNGRTMPFRLVGVAEAEPVDLILVATKFSGLEAAMEEMAPFVGPATIIFSVLNGITSEIKLAERFGEKNILHCVALGMDAVRVGTELSYQHRGMLKIGAVKDFNLPALDEVCGFFDQVGIAYKREQDILHALWAKLLLNVGINQTCMVYETNYGGAFDNPEACSNMYGAMHEVIAVAKAEGVNLGEEDFEESVRVLKGLTYEGMPSMRQDALAHRKSEVELFAGTISRLGQKHHLPTPINDFYYRRIQEMEAQY